MDKALVLLKDILNDFQEIEVDSQSNDLILGYNMAVKKLREKVEFMISQIK
jgi:hypothetical protein